MVFAWTEEAENTLLKMYKEGVSLSEIGDALGVSRSTISGKISRLRQRQEKAGEDSGGELKRRRPGTRAHKQPAVVQVAKDAPAIVQGPKKNKQLPPLVYDRFPEGAECKFPYGDLQKRMCFCGRKRVDHRLRAELSPYCEAHFKEAYIITATGSRRGRKPKGHFVIENKMLPGARRK